MTERTEPLTPTVLFVGDKRHAWRCPPIYRLTARYATPTTVACDPAPGADDRAIRPVPGRKVVVKQQRHVYPVRDDATWARVETVLAAVQQALDDLAAGLRELGNYARRLQEAGGIKTAPNPLCPTVIGVTDPDRRDMTGWYLADQVPHMERRTVHAHTPKMLRMPTRYNASEFATITSQIDQFVCPDDAAWERIEMLRNVAVARHEAWKHLLTHELTEYAMATKATPKPAPASVATHAITLPRTRTPEATDLGEELLGMLQDEGYTWSHADQTPDGRWHHVVRHHTSHGGRYRRERLAALFRLPAGSPAPLAIAEPAAIAGVVMMSADEARAAATRIQTAIGNLRQMIDDFDHREGWAALGYASFRAWAIAEVDDASLRHIYRLRDAADVDRSLGVTIGHTPESHARVLKPIPPADRPAVLARADELAGNQPRQAKHVAQAVTEQQAPVSAARKPETIPPVIPRPDPAWERAATRTLLGAAIDRAAGLPPLPDDLADWRWDIHTNPTGYQLLTPVPGLLWRTSVCLTPEEAIVVALDHMRCRPATALAAPSAPARPETPNRAASPVSAPLVQPAGTIGGAPDWRPVADRAIRHLNWPPPRLDDPNEQRRVYQEARDLLAAMAAGLGYAPETVTTELSVQIGIYRAPAPEPPDTPPDDPPPPPDDIAARAHALGVTLTDAGDGCLIPHWPGEDVSELIGMDSYEVRGWLLRTAPALAGDRIAAGTLTLPGIGWDDDTHATAEDYADVCAFLSDLAAAEAGGSLDTQTIRDMGDVLEGLVAVFDDDTYSALAGRVTTVQRGV